MSKRVYALAGLVYLTALIAATVNGHIPREFYLFLLGSLLVAEAFLTLVFLIGRQLKRFDVIDAAWGPSFIVIALAMYLISFGFTWDWNVSLLFVVLTVLWGGRLSWHIIQRIRRTDEEDRRYVELRRKWRGNVELHTFLRIYMVQGLLATLISIPIIYVGTVGANTFSLLISAGSVIWLVGYAIEVIADAQLASFKEDAANKGKLMTSGLWRYSRNPNYFGELTMWWGVAIIAAASEPVWVGLGGAVLISFLIIHVSGLPLKEASMAKRSGWEAYVARTRQLVPLPK